MAAAAELVALASVLTGCLSPTEALLAASRGCLGRIPGLAYVGLCVVSGDRTSVRLHGLHTGNALAPRPAPLPVASCAAGLAIGTRQPVHVRDMAAAEPAGPGEFEDVSYLAQEQQARCVLMLPLLVAQQVLGALCFAGTQPRSLDEHVGWLQGVAALCAPYLLLMRSQQELASLEGLVAQVLPVRVALQLRTSAVQQQAAQQAAAREPRLLAGAGGAGSSDSQGRGPPQQRRWAVRASEQQQRRSSGGLGWSLQFRHARLEAGFRAATCGQLAQPLDALFLLLMLASLLGGRLPTGLTGNPLVDALAASVGALAGARAWAAVQAQPVASYLRWRQPLLVGLRLLRVGLFAWQLHQLPPGSSCRPAQPAAASSLAAWLGIAQPELAGCSLLALLGLTGHLPLLLHAGVQAACCAAVLASLARLACSSTRAGLPLRAFARQALLSWLVPVAVVAAVHWRARVHWLHKVR